jgi:hypothetical protein
MNVACCLTVSLKVIFCGQIQRSSRPYITSNVPCRCNMQLCNVAMYLALLLSVWKILGFESKARYQLSWRFCGFSQLLQVDDSDFVT